VAGVTRRDVKIVTASIRGSFFMAQRSG